MKFGRIAFIIVGVVWAPAAALMCDAAAVAVPDGSFENSTAAPPATPFEFLVPPSPWTGTGGTGTGVFPNLATDVNFGGVVAKRITNADGAQLAYINAIYDPNGTTDAGVPVVNEIFQQIPSSYQPGQQYTLSVGVAISSVQPPPTGATLRLELYYLDASQARQPVSATLVANDATTNLANDALKYFTVQTPVVTSAAAYANQAIGILISTTDNGPTTGGTFDVDNVTLAAVPEPTTGAAALIAGCALLLGRRRQSRLLGANRTHALPSGTRST